jgi:hypothetical protein
MASKSRKNRRLRNNKNISKKHLERPETKIQFLNTGSTNTTVKKNDIVTNSSIDWSGNYNGKVADIHVSVDDNGRKEEMNIKLDNNDLTKLLGIPSINKQLDQRLMDDFYVRDGPQLYQHYDNNDNKIASIMDSFKFRNANGHNRSTNNRKNTKGKQKRYKK